MTPTALPREVFPSSSRLRVYSPVHETVKRQSHFTAALSRRAMFRRRYARYSLLDSVSVPLLCIFPCERRGRQAQFLQALHDLLAQLAGALALDGRDAEHRPLPLEPLDDDLAAGLPLLRRQQVQLVQHQP